MSIQLALPGILDVTGFLDEANWFDEGRMSAEGYLDSPIDEFGEAEAIRSLYQEDVADEPEE